MRVPASALCGVPKRLPGLPMPVGTGEQARRWVVPDHPVSAALCGLAVNVVKEREDAFFEN